MAAAGGILGGLFTEAIIKRSSVDIGRKASIVLGSLPIICGFVGIILFVDNSNYMMFIYLAGIALGFQFAIGNIQTLSSDLSEAFSGNLSRTCWNCSRNITNHYELVYWENYRRRIIHTSVYSHYIIGCTGCHLYIYTYHQSKTGD